MPMGDRKGRGRPRTLDDELQKQIVNAIRLGNYMETAAAYAGVSKAALYEWLRRGRREKKRLEKDGRFRIRKSEAAFVSFVDAIEKALGYAEVMDLKRIAEAAANGNWQAAAWKLERKFPERWGRREVIRHEGEVTAGVMVVPGKADPLEWDKQAQAVRLQQKKDMEDALGGQDES